jgi:hypothetical protein
MGHDDVLSGEASPRWFDFAGGFLSYKPIAFSADSRELFSVWGTSLRRWSIETGGPLHPFVPEGAGYISNITVMTVSPDRSMIALGLETINFGYEMQQPERLSRSWWRLPRRRSRE